MANTDEHSNELPRNLLWDPGDLRLTQPPGCPAETEQERAVREAIELLRSQRRESG